MEENKHIIVFNKISKAFYCRMSNNAIDHVDKYRFITKLVEFDEDTHTWDGGDFDYGKVVSKKDILPKVYEKDVDNICSSGISGFYSTHNQLNVIMGVLNHIIDSEKLSGDSIDDFKDIYNFIEKRRLMNERYKKAYKHDPNWEYISKQDNLNQLYKRLDGGLFEQFDKSEL
jgi:hypothetical protein